jgi:hypothetical protein
MLEDATRHMVEATTAGGVQDASESVNVEDIMKFAALECTKKAMRRLCEVKGKPNTVHALPPFPLHVSSLRDYSRDHGVPVLVRKPPKGVEKKGGGVIHTSYHAYVKVPGAKSRQGRSDG